MIEGVHRPYDEYFDISIENEIYDIQHRIKNLNVEREQTVESKVDKVSIKFLIFTIKMRR